MKTQHGVLLALLALGLVVVASGCGGEFGTVSAGARSYVGSDACTSCHSEIATRATPTHGHPYKLNPVKNGLPPTYPHSSVPSPPDPYSWNDVTYVIGGYGWKARFIDSLGYIVTGTHVQWNLATAQWVAYHSGDPAGTKPYDCGGCHTTGWVATGSGGPHQDDLPGMYGTFEEPGIGCEACHGPGSAHVQSGSSADIEVDTSAEQCGGCHFRDAQHRIEVSGGFIRHHEQYDEWLASPHNNPLTCVDCHHAHYGTRYDTTGAGIVQECEDCHLDEAAYQKHNSLADCVDCHMPRAGKSAVKVHDHEGDVRTHIWEIKHDSADKSDMWYSEGGKTYSHGFVTLDFACYGCHKDTSNVGGPASQQSAAELIAMADEMHGPHATSVSSPATRALPLLGPPERRPVRGRWQPRATEFEMDEE
ncbi:MAG: multiheme c-type cytochrome [Armatimonadota bacterium]